MDEKIYAELSVGGAEYSKTEAAVDIDELIASLTEAKEDGATHVVVPSGNYRGAQWLSFSTHVSIDY